MASYEVLTELGRGDDTIVSKGFDKDTGKKVAIKSLAAKWEEADPHRKEQFLREGRAQANLADSHIVDVYSVDKTTGWIVMEYMDGSLADELKSGVASSERVRDVLASSLQALRSLHAEGKVHGRVRPSNLLYDEQKRVKLSDFASINDGEELPPPRGDFKYLAPELIDPSWGQIGPATDLYCLGFTALEMLLGPKFDSLFGGGGGALGENRQNFWMRWHASPEQLRPARELVPSIPGDLADAIDSMLVKKVDGRAKDAGQLLKKLQSGSFASAPPPAPAPIVPATPAPAAPVYAKPAPEAESGGISPWVWLVVLLLVAGGVAAIFLLPKKEELAQVAVDSDPPGALLSINDKPPSGKKTPVKLSLSAKKHKIKFELEGYKPKEEEIEVVAGKEPPALNVKLEKIGEKPVTPPVTPPMPMPAQFITVAVECDIQTATVNLPEGKKVPMMGGKAIWQQARGEPIPKFTVTAENFETQTIESKPTDINQADAVIAVKLRPIVKVEPADATVALTGVDSLPPPQEGKVTLPRTADDKYHLSVKKEGYEPLEKDFTLADLQAAKFSLALKKSEPPPVAMVEPFGKKLKLHHKLKIDSDLYQVAFSPNGDTIYAACRDNRLEVFDLKKLTRAKIKTDGPVLSIAVRPSTKTESNVILAGGDAEKNVFIYRTIPPPAGTSTSDVSNMMGHNEAVRAVAFHPAATWLVSGSADGDIGWWDVEKGEAVASPLKQHRHQQEVRAFAFDKDGIWFASAGADNKLNLSILKGQQKSTQQVLGSTVNCLAFDPRGKFLASGDARGWINFWNLESQSESEGFQAHAIPGEGGASPSGVAVQRLVYVIDEKAPPIVISAGRDKLVRFWDPDKRKASEAPPLAHDGPVLDLSFHLGTKRLATCTQNEVYVWDEVGPMAGESFEVK